MIKVLGIIQLPRECGGSYTTGIARVGEGLYKERVEGVEMYWYFTNVKQSVAKEIDNGGGHYYGYIWPVLLMIRSFLMHPIKTIFQWKHYYKTDSVNPIRFDFYKNNFYRVIKKIRPDIVHMHSAGVAPLYYANEKFKIPIVLTFHGIMYNPKTGVWEQNREAFEANLKMVNYFTALNKEVQRKAISLGVDENKLWVIPNGTNSSSFYYSQEKRRSIRNQYNVGDSTIVFITVGAVVERKGQYDFLIWLESQNINYQYWVAGEGPDKSKIEQYVAMHNLGNKVKLMGYTDSRQLYAYYSAADVYAHVSTTEGQAMVEIEAYATGLPTIVRTMIKNTVIGDSDDLSHYFVLDMDGEVDGGRDTFKRWYATVKKQERKSQTGCDWPFVAKKYGDCYKDIIKRIENNE